MKIAYQIMLSLSLVAIRQFYDEDIPGLRLKDTAPKIQRQKQFYDDDVDYPFGRDLYDVEYEHFECELEECETT